MTPAAEAQTPAAAPAASASNQPVSYLTLSALEALFLSAIADAMIPADELSPSGPDCGVVVFIVRHGRLGVPQNAGYNPTGTVGALGYWSANAITSRYIKSPGPLV